MLGCLSFPTKELATMFASVETAIEALEMLIHQQLIVLKLVRLNTLFFYPVVVHLMAKVIIVNNFFFQCQFVYLWVNEVILIIRIIVIVGLRVGNSELSSLFKVLTLN